MSDSLLPRADDVLLAAARISPHASVTPVLRSHTLDALAGAQLAFKAEHLQRGGAFKFRGACNAVWSLDAGRAGAGVVTHSSGNHGAALATGAQVMPACEPSPPFILTGGIKGRFNARARS